MKKIFILVLASLFISCSEDSPNNNEESTDSSGLILADTPAQGYKLLVSDTLNIDDILIGDHSALYLLNVNYKKGSRITHPPHTIGKIKACDPEGHGIRFQIIGTSVFSITRDGYVFIKDLSVIRPGEHEILVRATDMSKERLWTEKTIKITVTE